MVIFVWIYKKSMKWRVARIDISPIRCYFTPEPVFNYHYRGRRFMYIVLLQLIPSEFTIIYYLITFAIYSGSDRSNCTKNSTIWTIDPYTKRCPEEDWTVPVIAALHMLFANLLLVNLVIAKFRYRY